LRVVFMGTPEFAIPSLEHLVFNQHQVVAVYTQPDSLAGRGRSLVLSPVKQAAIQLGLPVVQPLNFKKQETIAQLAGFQPDIIIVAAFGQILSQAVLDIPRYKCINIHPSLLPQYRGASPVAAAILVGDDFAGVTIMLMDAGLDTGPVLSQAQVAISSQDTTGSLTDKLSLVSAHLLLEVLTNWLRGELTPRPQGGTSTAYTAMLTKTEGEIDWRLPALEIWRRVRAFQPWPGCYTDWRGKQLKIIEAAAFPAEESLQIGKVVALDRGGAAFGVNTGEGVLGVLQVQLEGRRAMSAAEFLRGQPGLVGTVLPSSQP
jgi:methionyl-tRNA formyltransferase